MSFSKAKGWTCFISKIGTSKRNYISDWRWSKWRQHDYSCWCWSWYKWTRRSISSKSFWLCDRSIQIPLKFIVHSWMRSLLKKRILGRIYVLQEHLICSSDFLVWSCLCLQCKQHLWEMALSILQSVLYFSSNHVVFNHGLRIWEGEALQRTKILHHWSSKFTLLNLKILGLDILRICIKCFDLYHRYPSFWSLRRRYLAWRKFCILWSGNCCECQSVTWHKFSLFLFNFFHFWFNHLFCDLLLCRIINKEFSYLWISHHDRHMLRILFWNDFTLLWSYLDWNHYQICQSWNKTQMAKNHKKDQRTIQALIFKS